MSSRRGEMERRRKEREEERRREREERFPSHQSRREKQKMQDTGARVRDAQMFTPRPHIQQNLSGYGTARYFFAAI